MAVYFRSKDKKTRHIVSKFEFKRLKLQFFLRNTGVSREDKNRLDLLKLTSLGKALKFSSKSRNRCALTNRAGSVFRHFRLSRIMLKQLASRGLLTGTRKSSW